MSSRRRSPFRVVLAVLATAAIGLSSLVTHAASLNEGFESVLPAGWTVVNNSQTPDSGWFQGDPLAPSSFPAHLGTDASYAAVNFASTAHVNNQGLMIGDISNWLITPTLTFNNGDVLSFWTRTTGQQLFADRLEVRFSDKGGIKVGSSKNSVGDFKSLLVTINPDLTTTDYPTSWTQTTVTFSGLAGSTNGAIGFRYHVPNGGPDSFDYSDYIGLDTVSVTAVPEPSAYALAAAGLLIVGAVSRRRRAKELDG